MLDLGWYWGVAVSLLIVVVSMLPERFKPFIIVFSLIGVVVFGVLGYQRRNEAAGEPSVGIENVSLDIWKDKVCFNTILRNGGSATAYLNASGNIRIEGLEVKQAAPLPVTIAANGGTIPFALCLPGAQAVMLAQARAHTSDDMRFYYHGDKGQQQYSLCVSGYWDYDMGRFWVGGPVGPCKNRAELRSQAPHD
jgi:hypothetical protein